MFFSHYSIKKMVLSLLIVIGLLIVATLAWVFPWNISLQKTHTNIEKTYHNVQHVDAQALNNINSENVLIFDVRELDEFEVSHIEGAIRVSPDIDPYEFDNKFSDLIADKTVIFYCSVGVRSSILASKLEPMLDEAEAFYNLKGGIFQWHNESRPIVKENNIPTGNIHPYNDYWGKLIENKLSISYF